MAFIGLTYYKMPQCQLRVFYCFSFQKSYTGNILRIGRNEKPDFYFLDTYTEYKGEKEGSPEASTPPGGATPPLGAPGSCVGPTGALDHRTSAYLYPPDAKTLKSSIIFHKKFRHAATLRARIKERDDYSARFLR